MNNPAAAVSTDGNKKHNETHEYSNSSNALQRYLTTIGRYSLLSKKKQLALAKLAQNGDQKSKDQLINCNLRLVVSIAKEYYQHTVPLLDLIDEGNLGLIYSIDKFKPDLGFAFSTYACYWIRHKIERALIEQGRLVRIPINKHKELNRFLRLAYQFQNEHGYWPKPDEIKNLNLIEQKKFAYLMQLNQEVISLDMPLADDNSLCLADVLCVEESSSCYGIELDKKMAMDFLSSAIKQLSSLQRKIIQSRYGLYDHPNRTLAELGEEFGLSPERVRQIQLQALKKLHAIFAEQGFDFNDINLFD